MLTMVLDLNTGDGLYYSLPPNEAVVCAWYRERKQSNTSAYDFSKAHVSKSGRTVSCGNFAAILNK